MYSLDLEEKMDRKLYLKSRVSLGLDLKDQFLNVRSRDHQGSKSVQTEPNEPL